jgi:hypothetical protein
MPLNGYLTGSGLNGDNNNRTRRDLLQRVREASTKGTR